VSHDFFLLVSHGINNKNKDFLFINFKITNIGNSIPKNKNIISKLQINCSQTFKNIIADYIMLPIGLFILVYYI